MYHRESGPWGSQTVSPPFLDCSQSKIVVVVCKIVEIQLYALPAAILDGYGQNLGFAPSVHLKIKMAAINDKTRYISTISRTKRGL